MAEIGLVTFVRVALAVGQAALPAYRSKFSKRQFTQPQLLAVLCLMRYEDWTFREAEVRLAEHRELRAALGLPVVPDYTTLDRFLRRLTVELLEQTLSAVVQRLIPQIDGPVTVAVDATGLTPGAISTFFVKRIKDRSPGFTWRHWLKWTMAIDVDRRVILAQTARRGPTNDCATLRPLVDAAHQRVPIALVLADAEFDSERNHQHIRTVLQAQSIIPAKRGGADCRLVKCAKESAGKRDGTSGKKIGNAYLKWAFSEAAVLFLRNNPAGQKYCARVVKKHGKGKALTVLAHKLARAVYYMCKRDTAFDLDKFLHE
jgi:Transposase DDE domain/Transposase domain (DUF772)